ncbi:MAG: hypothetical protein UX42_C0007G0003 [Microgenomates group bacterium GW2011_GWC1_46_20]|nr:MAG: hypothetical protein UX42_C0007G0003 [Microgenomates group bacterium GW2011_GWC1_46_20]
MGAEAIVRVVAFESPRILVGTALPLASRPEIWVLGAKEMRAGPEEVALRVRMARTPDP